MNSAFKIAFKYSHNINLTTILESLTFYSLTNTYMGKVLACKSQKPCQVPGMAFLVQTGVGLCRSGFDPETHQHTTLNMGPIRPNLTSHRLHLRMRN